MARSIRAKPVYSLLFRSTAPARFIFIECASNVARLKLDPDWDPLRGDPHFEKIVASLAPKQ